MKYLYYPGCSLEGTALEYDSSTRAVMRELGAELVELEDWTCCGASAADSINYLFSMVLPARNLALAERAGLGGADLLVPCSACYLNLKRAQDHIGRDDRLLGKINELLGEEGLKYRGGVGSRHLLDVLVRDVGPERIKARVKNELKGFRVAPYYGCQCLRPYKEFDDPEQPRSMEPLIEALGADVHRWTMGARCCGASLMTTKKQAALELVSGLLASAEGADCIVTVCPMCQMNLESHQQTVSRAFGEDLSMTILYLPQLMGVAFGLPGEDLKLKLNLAITKPLEKRLSAGQT